MPMPHTWVMHSRETRKVAAANLIIARVRGYFASKQQGLFVVKGGGERASGGSVM